MVSVCDTEASLQ